MFDEEGRKIDLGLQVGMSLEGMSADELESYIQALHDEINRVQAEKEAKQASLNAADAFFK